MRLVTLFTLLPLALSAPTADNEKRSVPELNVKEWNSIQSGFIDRVWSGLSDWSWAKASEIVGTTADESKTVWQQLKEDGQFSKVVKAIEFAEVEHEFDSDKNHFTFFAPNNDALKPPPGFPHHHHDHDHDSLIAALEANPSKEVVASLFDSSVFESLEDKHGGHHDDDKDRERRRKIFKLIVRKILQYHVIAHPLTAQELAQNSTIATMLKAEDGSFAGLHRRVSIEKQLVPPAVHINFYAKVVSADNKASNGIYHVVNHPLIPPGSIFDSLYLATDFFSTLTQSIYGIDGKELLDWHYDRKNSKPGKPAFTGNPLATVFAPVNSAFHALPSGLKFFLFSPFGERALAKVLAYHSIPHTLLLSELFVESKHKHGHGHGHEAAEVEYFNLGDDPSFHKEFDIHTALPNATLHIVIDKSKVLPVEGAVKTTIKVNDQQTLAIDVQARNGAFHPIGKLLVPPHHHHDEDGADIAHLDTWENWGEWLPAFAAEA